MLEDRTCNSKEVKLGPRTYSELLHVKSSNICIKLRFELSFYSKGLKTRLEYAEIPIVHVSTSLFQRSSSDNSPFFWLSSSFQLFLHTILLTP
jgi:hypothetical protein